jgi:hypothetical protein
VTDPHFGHSSKQITPAVRLDTTQANGVVTAGVEKCWSRFDHHDMHDVFIVISEGGDGEHIARTAYATGEDDARQTHRENYTDEPIVGGSSMNHAAASAAPTGEGASSMHDHFTVISNEGDRRHTRTVIAANERDAKQTHREHYPTCTVTTVAANGKRRAWRPVTS